MEQQTIMVNYTPHPDQKPFHDDRYKVFARLASAGTGGGKTYLGWYETFLWAFENTGCVGAIFEPTNHMLRRILLPTFEDLFGLPPETCPLVESYRRLDNLITWINGSKTWLIGLDEPERAEGINLDYAWVDEFRLVGGSGPSAPRKQQTAWRVIIRRLRGSGGGHHTGLWITTTPDAPGSVLHSKFEHPKTRLKNSKVYRWSIYDNPHLPKEYYAEIEASHSGGLAERFIHGRFAAVSSGSFAFDYTVHVVEEVDPVRIKRWVYGVDFGWSNPSCIVAAGFDGDGRCYVMDELYQPRLEDQRLLDEAVKLRDTYGKGLFLCDRSEPKTISYLSRGVPALADESKRDDGIRALGGRFPVQKDDRPRIYVHERCVNLIAELQVYDAERKEYDHAVDALRYALGRELPSGEISVSFGKRPR